jgi:hypothetical protein
MCPLSDDPFVRIAWKVGCWPKPVPTTGICPGVIPVQAPGFKPTGEIHDRSGEGKRSLQARPEHRIRHFGVENKSWVLWFGQHLGIVYNQKVILFPLLCGLYPFSP